MALRTALLLSSLNLILLFLSASSLVPIFVLKSSPTSFGWALFTVSFITIVSSLIGFCSQLTPCCFMTHIYIALASLTGQVLSFLSLFLKHESTRSLLSSQRDRKEVWILMFLLEITLFGMALVQCFVLILGCVVEKRWKREDEEQLEREEMDKKRMARVQEEPMLNKEVEFKGMNEMSGGFGKLGKNDIERC
ncbi:hypothetical protein LUZ60_005643 [Juncus effusus]|nr:hypothetical protein LUZ60_005643 [Juncus effusus]